MTQDKVDLIYEYLHENYEYKNGDLYKKIDVNNKKFPKKAGNVSYPSADKGYPHLMASFRIKGIVFSSSLSHFIWIYHYKKKPEFIIYNNGNRMDCRIENLQSVNWSYIQYQRVGNNQGYKKSGNLYRVCVYCSDYEGSLGAYETPELAKEIYLLARSLLMKEPFTMKELREEICKLHPLAKKPRVIKAVMPFAYINKLGRFDSKFKCEDYSVYLGSYDTPREAHNAAIEFKKEYKNNPKILKKVINKITNKSGARNVYETIDGYFAQITIDRKTYRMGPFKTINEASNAFLKAKKTGEFESFDGNEIIQRPCSECEINMVSIKLRARHLKKYCLNCKKKMMKEIDRNRKHNKKKSRVLTRDFKQYHLGYFETKEESNKAYKEAYGLYEKNIDAFKGKYTRFRELKPKTKEQNRSLYIKHRNNTGKLVREQLKNENP